VWNSESYISSWYVSVFCGPFITFPHESCRMFPLWTSLTGRQLVRSVKIIAASPSHELRSFAKLCPQLRNILNVHPDVSLSHCCDEYGGGQVSKSPFPFLLFCLLARCCRHTTLYLVRVTRSDSFGALMWWMLV
jgi:hypothetical protein